jgi:hypothetical protein
MTEGPEVSTTPAIPAQRAPESPTAEPAAAQPPIAEPPAPEAVAAQPVSAEPVNSEPVNAEPVSAEPVTAQRIEAGALGAAPLAAPPFAGEPSVPQPSFPGPVLPGPPASGAAGAGARRRTRIVAGVAILAVLVLVLIVGVAALGGGRKPRSAAAATPSAVAVSVSATPATPYDQATAVLKEQSAALVKGDQTAFLATVAASLQSRYRDLYQALRALGVTAFDYQLGLGQKVSGDPSAVQVRADAAYCFGAAMCPAGASGWAAPPHIEQMLTLKPVGGRYVITKVAKTSSPDFHQPLPWETGKLTVAQGRRVTLVAPPDQVKNLAQVLAVADQAAVIDDKFAALNHTPQTRYRIFLAGEKEWKSWYGGVGDKWAIGVSVPLNMYGTDVMLRMRELTDPRTLRVTLQHELGHVVTLDGAFRYDAAEDTWLSEGIAEYIGWWPKPASRSFRVASVRWAFGGKHRPTSIVPAEPGENASLRSGDAFYGLSHFAVDCMAHKYGQTKLFDFVRLVLTEDNSYDQAAHDAYGVGFGTVDSACRAWIRSQV